jgi:hypothetical protein
MVTAKMPLAMQTVADAAQRLECQIYRAWKVFDRVRDAPPSRRARLRRPVGRIVRQVRDLDVGFDDWQVLNRQALQLEQALRHDLPAADAYDLRCDDITAVDLKTLGANRILDQMEVPTRKQMKVLREPGEALPAPAAAPRSAAPGAPISVKKIVMPVRQWAAALSAIVVAELLSVSAALTLVQRVSVGGAAVIAGAPVLGIGFAAVMVWRRRR